ncbi:virulence factor [Longirhabdus pacifica]|uniref:virulence factor n=1 Tax=Longirhabdus pacifica TaxID=2305227 RepID=UPI00100872D9|nr:virulence factor [Longirhabdus pacifica]
MNILSIEPTPSPNTMKLNMDESVSKARTYTTEHIDKAPSYITKLLHIEGVKSVFQTADFIAVDRVANADWLSILNQIKQIFGEQDGGEQSDAQMTDDFGEVHVYVQTFRKIPMQIRVKTEMEEVRESLAPRFVDAAMNAGMASPNLIKERTLEDYGVRYGELKEIASEVLEELEAAYDDERLTALQTQAQKIKPGEEINIITKHMSVDEVLHIFQDTDWRKRYAALEQMEPTLENRTVIEKALADEKMTVRRLAVVYLGEIGGKVVLPLLYKALQDRSAVVRRTAGDTLSDIADPDAIKPMAACLSDDNKLVRWRAARYLYEVGDETALDALKKAQHDSEFEVKLQIQMAIQRIESGEKAAGTVWQQMTRVRQGHDENE